MSGLLIATDSIILELLNQSEYLERRHLEFTKTKKSPDETFGEFELTGIYPKRKVYASKFFTVDGIRIYCICKKPANATGIKYAQN